MNETFLQIFKKLSIEYYYSDNSNFSCPFPIHPFQPHSSGSNINTLSVSLLFCKPGLWSLLTRHFPPESGSNIFFATKTLIKLKFILPLFLLMHCVYLK